MFETLLCGYEIYIFRKENNLDMSKKWKAAMYGVAFVAGCEIGIAIQLMKMIHKFNVKESALNETIPEETLESGEFPDGEVSPA